MNRRKLIAAVMGGAKPVIYLLRDEFVTDDDAPITSPRNCAPGPGTLTAVQADGNYAIASGLITTTGQDTPDWTSLGVYNNDAIVRGDGVAFMCLASMTGGNALGYLGFTGAKSISTSNWSSALYRSSTKVMPFNGTTSYENYWPIPIDQIIGIVLKASGALFFEDDHLMYSVETSTTTPLYVSQLNRDLNFSADYFRVCQLAAPFNTSDCYALHSDDTPEDGDTAVGSADGFIRFTWTPALNEILNIRYRYVDDDNCMIMRCDQGASTVTFIRRYGGTETPVLNGSKTLAFTVGTAYDLWVRYFNQYNRFGCMDKEHLTQNGVLDAFQFTSTGVKIDGFATGAKWRVYPYYLTGAALTEYRKYSNPYNNGYRTQNIISVADGGDITAAIATMRRGDILSLAAGGSYTIAGGATGIASLPNGFNGVPTEVRGNGATITGGAYGITFGGKENFKISDLNFLDQTVYCLNIASCINFEFYNCTFKSTASVGFADNCVFDKCKNFNITNCEAGPSTGIASCDGFECYGECLNGTFTNCEATGVIHGFEVWTGAAPNWINHNINFVGCNSHNNDVGFSCEGGVQSLTHYNIVATNCLTADNAIADYSADNNAILYRVNSPGTKSESTGGTVVDL